jgi:branched-chain amino acid transport system substrate-binding protein
VGWGYMPGFCGNSYGFGFNGCTSPADPELANGSLTGGIIDLAELGEDSTVALQSYDNEAGRVPLLQLEANFEAAGVDIVYSDSTMPVTDAADFTPFVQEIMGSADGSAPDAVVMITTFANTIGLTGALKAAGYDGTTLNYITYSPGLLDSQAQVADSLDGTFINTQMLPEEFGGPAIEQMKEDLAAIGADEQISIGTSVGYWSADLTVQMLEAVGEDLTPETFDEVINGGFTYEPLGDPMGIGPVEFPRDHDQPTPCAAIVVVKDSTYEPAVPMTCYDMVPIE